MKLATWEMKSCFVRAMPVIFQERAFLLCAQEEMPESHEKASRFLLVHFWMLAAWVHCANWSLTFTPVGGREGG